MDLKDLQPVLLLQRRRELLGRERHGRAGATSAGRDLGTWGEDTQPRYGILHNVQLVQFRTQKKYDNLYTVAMKYHTTKTFEETKSLNYSGNVTAVERNATIGTMETFEETEEERCRVAMWRCLSRFT